TFLRFPQMIMSADAMTVFLPSTSLSSCLDYCLDHRPESGEEHVCKSLEFYPDNKECIINLDNRHSE
ncbi:hypothetical protein PMAYCL1PPCAC_24668, partial [Pristionchus mayeri]